MAMCAAIRYGQISFFIMLPLRALAKQVPSCYKVDLHLLDRYGSREVARHCTGFTRTCFYFLPLTMRWEAASAGIKRRDLDFSAHQCINFKLYAVRDNLLVSFTD